MNLTQEEITNITKKSRYSAQRRALEHLGIPYKTRPDGSPVVLRAMMEAVFGHATKTEKSPSPRLRLPEARRVLLREKGQVAQARSDLHTALQEYARIVATPEGGLPDLIDKALPAIVKGKADITVKQYSYCARVLKEIFAEFRPDQVRHGDVVQMMDAYAESTATANRLLTVLRLVYKWGLDRGLVEHNPTLNVSRIAQVSRDRLISEHEYAAIYSHCPEWLQVIMDLCYLTGQRIGDVLTIERKHLLDDGIFFKQQKTGKLLVVAWTPELRAVVERAKALPASVHALRYLISTRGGKPRAHQNVWRTFKIAAAKAGVLNVTLHDLRALAGTEAERQGIDPTALLGHTDARTTRAYLRDKTAKVVSGPRKKAS